ncbi:hypothetical protein OG920_30725 [Streptomyces europaeiscabiei]|jgi:hypothetical protein|uniref:Uncharacterized protein n=1 Tax=Streptomyces europaeiscabiei TaxID=146819 RepID=A0ABU4NR29_9ACTN|nr:MULTISPECIES: hypothetical protein [Streptomyces]MDX3548814.1 hypothetical protein [Streptomyces europaeiscabiei]MDX3555132.1 hypothetical protein [Streptomyces europaeiscabiei]MDX3705146.1 hypothetical protein [Streptomyces europaeiscabiei]WRY95729.1 hypothetical protein OG889_13885 [Streptomyces sp. NBC_00481]
MRPCIRIALEHSAELTRNNRLVDALALGEAALSEATDDERAEIRQWLTDHTRDFTGEDDS